MFHEKFSLKHNMKHKQNFVILIMKNVNKSKIKNPHILTLKIESSDKTFRKQQDFFQIRSLDDF